MRRGARRKFAERFAEASPAGLGEKGEARPLSRMARGLCRGRRGSRQRRYRHSRGPAQAARNRPRDRAARAGPRGQAAEQARGPHRAGCRRRDQGDAAGHLCRQERALGAALRRPPRHRRQGPQARARTGAPRRDHPEHRRGLVERQPRRLHGADRARRQRARAEFADRAISATAAAARRRKRLGYGAAPRDAGRPRRRSAPRARNGESCRRAAGDGRSQRLPGHVQDSGPRQRRRQRGRKSLRIATADHRARSCWSAPCR